MGAEAGSDGNSGGTGIAAQLSIVSAIIGILTWFGVSNWHDFTSKVFPGGTGSNAQPSGTSTLPSPFTILPSSFTYAGTQYSLTRPPVKWIRNNGAYRGSVAVLYLAEYRADDNPYRQLDPDITLFKDEKSADDTYLAESPSYVNTRPEDWVVSGRYLISVQVFEIGLSKPRIEEYGAGAALAARIAQALPQG